MIQELTEIFNAAKNKLKQLLSLKKDKQHYADCVIRNEKGQILLLQRSYQDDFQPGKWCLPGGKIEAGEEPDVAAGRELYEETGLSDVNLSFLKDVERKDSISLYYEGFVYSNNAQLLDNDEHYRSQWVNFSDIKDYDLILDLGSILPQLPLTFIETARFNGAPTIGEDLYTKWILSKTQFDKGEIDEQEYFDSIALYKGAAALELIKRGFDEGQISNEKFTTYFSKTTGPIKSLLKYSGSCSNEQLQEIV